MKGYLSSEKCKVLEQCVGCRTVALQVHVLEFGRKDFERKWPVRFRSPGGNRHVENSDTSKLNTTSAYTRQKAKSNKRNRIRFERESQKQSSDTHITPYDRVKLCPERKIYIKASERINADQDGSPAHSLRMMNDHLTHVFLELLIVRRSSCCMAFTIPRSESTGRFLMEVYAQTSSCSSLRLSASFRTCRTYIVVIIIFASVDHSPLETLLRFIFPIIILADVPELDDAGQSGRNVGWPRALRRWSPEFLAISSCGMEFRTHCSWWLGWAGDLNCAADRVTRCSEQTLARAQWVENGGGGGRSGDQAGQGKFDESSKNSTLCCTSGRWTDTVSLN
ncbi:hypothetical protein PR048_016258 [Dryococelus australis]|uniref:Uncharacterized protein n=1 Tax=Dryococelus australis TaxID=614101 RepID=A0ABQ9HJ85_9NEOP|nr:hypothetical protein PR048_016258 [Dryococelus australis]